MEYSKEQSDKKWQIFYYLFGNKFKLRTGEKMVNIGPVSLLFSQAVVLLSYDFLQPIVFSC
uniref:Uncharacterized protein n=1 Tax=uncultured Desulfobacterium sp. TaxID=201089 RepID=E1YDH5_9BACT|nr:unknown protein [uncultured Desulfobacterium sp.]